MTTIDSKFVMYIYKLFQDILGIIHLNLEWIIDDFYGKNGTS